MELAAEGRVTEEVYRDNLAVRERLRAAYTAALRPADGAPLDALVYPTVPLPAPPVGDATPPS